ncbi:E3 ubiquitin protein ligase RNFT1-like protein [Tanacetum coccineum]
METTDVSIDDSTNSDENLTGTSSVISSSNSFPIIRFLNAPVTTVLEYAGVIRPRLINNEYHESESDRLIHDHEIDHTQARGSSDSVTSSSSNGENGEVSIRIIGGGDEGGDGGESGEAGASVGGGVGEREVADSSDVDGGNGGTGSGSHGDSSYQQRYDMQQVSRWVEQILPFSLLLMIVFIRQHLQGFFVTIYVSAFMYKSNDILRKQTALKGERKFSVLAGYYIVFVLQVIGVYWWYQNEDLCYPLFMVPPRAIPPFWHAIFTILVNDTMVRQSAMAFKLVLLMYYRNGKGHNFRRQHALSFSNQRSNADPGRVWAAVIPCILTCSSLVGSFWTALKALSRKEVHYGSNATPEQVIEAGDMCAICQEKMQAPILLRCKHIFCEDCVSERGRSPKSGGGRYGDGFTRRTLRTSPAGPDDSFSSFHQRNIDMLRTMIKEHDQHAKAKATPKKLVYDDSEELGSDSSGAKGLSKRFSNGSSETSETPDRARSTSKSQRSLSRSLTSSHQRRSERLENRNKPKAKARMSHPDIGGKTGIRRRMINHNTRYKIEKSKMH